LPDAFSRSIAHVSWALRFAGGAFGTVAFRAEFVALRVNHSTVGAVGHVSLSEVAVLPAADLELEVGGSYFERGGE
jgi:hypothetical protein